MRFKPDLLNVKITSKCTSYIDKGYIDFSPFIAPSFTEQDIKRKRMIHCTLLDTFVVILINMRLTCGYCCQYISYQKDSI